MRAFLLCLLLVPSTYAEDTWLGQSVMQKNGAKVQNGNRVIPNSELPSPIVVLAVNDEWLDVGPGFLKSSEVVRLEDAAAYYTDYLRDNPNSVWAYSSRGLAWSLTGQPDKAIKDLSEAIRIDPKNSWAYAKRGIEWEEKGDFDKAFEDYNEAIRFNPAFGKAYNNRGVILKRKGEFDEALSDFTEAIRLDPKYATAYSNRGSVWSDKGEKDNALKDYSEAIRLDPKYPNTYNNQAWLWATCPDEKYRDGKKAIESATKACELTGWKSWSNVGTLAASYAEAGDFESAVKWSGKSLELAPKSNKKELQERLDLYKSGKPYRDEPKAK